MQYSFKAEMTRCFTWVSAQWPTGIDRDQILRKAAAGLSPIKGQKPAYFKDLQGSFFCGGADFGLKFGFKVAENKLNGSGSRARQPAGW